MGAYQVVARNFSEAHENKIHDDEIARKYGFEGALVPGVAVYGHLTFPLVEKFGETWLGHSLGSVRFLKPAYHGDKLDISYVEDDTGHHTHCHNQHGVLLAELHTTMPDVLPEIEDQSIFANTPKPSERFRSVAEFLDPLELVQDDRMSDVEIRRRGIHPEFDAQRALFFQRDDQPQLEFFLAVERHGAVAHHVQLPRGFAREGPVTHRRHPEQSRTFPSVTIASIWRSLWSCGTASTIWNS